MTEAMAQEEMSGYPEERSEEKVRKEKMIKLQHHCGEQWGARVLKVNYRCSKEQSSEVLKLTGQRPRGYLTVDFQNRLHLPSSPTAQTELMDPYGHSETFTTTSSSGTDHAAPFTLHAAGLNAHNQLLPTPGRQDVTTFTPLAVPQTSRILFSGWSTTAILTRSSLEILGNESTSQPLDAEVLPSLHSAIGDHEGLLGCLCSNNGALFTFDADTARLEPQGDDYSPRLGLMALAGNGRVAITFKQAPNGNLCHLLQFESFKNFISWFRDPAATKLDAETQHLMLPGRPKQLVAGTGTFFLLMEGGEVYSWGDPRYRSLGREIDDVPAEKAGVVQALAGLKIARVVAGGWMGAAVSEDRAAYIWGSGVPGTDRLVKPLRDAAAGEVVLVDIGDGLDVLDVAVGEGHLAVIVEGGRLFGLGDNKNGQLGLGEDAPDFIDHWTEVLHDHTVHEVLCGPKATFASIALPPNT